jgi:hypothetical protein
MARLRIAAGHDFWASKNTPSPVNALLAGGKIQKEIEKGKGVLYQLIRPGKQRVSKTYFCT